MIFNLVGLYEMLARVCACAQVIVPNRGWMVALKKNMTALIFCGRKNLKAAGRPTLFLFFSLRKAMFVEPVVQNASTRVCPSHLTGSKTRLYDKSLTAYYTGGIK